MSISKFKSEPFSQSFSWIPCGMRTLLILSIAISWASGETSVAQVARVSMAKERESDASRWSSFCNGGNSRVSDDAAFTASWSPKEGEGISKPVVDFARSPNSLSKQREFWRIPLR